MADRQQNGGVVYFSRRPMEQRGRFSQGPLGTAFHLAKAPQGFCYLCRAERATSELSGTRGSKQKRLQLEVSRSDLLSQTFGKCKSAELP